MKNKWIYIAYSVAWISVGTAVCFGIWCTCNPMFLLGFLFTPNLKYRNNEEENYDK